MLLLVSGTAFANGPQLDNLTKAQVEDVAKEFAVNFSHTAVAAPETEGNWGIEVGVVGGRTSSPDLKDVINSSGGKGSDFANVYHAGAMARAHFPFDLFAEMTLLPSTTISDVDVSNMTWGAGWNAGAHFGLPLDVALGLNYSSAEVSFKQDQTGGAPVRSEITLKAKSMVYWVGVSKKFWIVTPYLKAGAARTNSDIDVDSTATIFQYTNSQSETVSSSGSYMALGANLQLLLLRLGFEASNTIGVKRISGKLSFAF